MSNQKNTITLNGKRYDAVTGRLLESAQRVQQVVDNVVQAAHGANHPAKTSHQRTPNHPSHIARHKPQHTQTLMRHAVQKPKPTDNSNSHSLHLPSRNERLARATAIPKSKLVRRFNSAPSSTLQPSMVKKTAALPVRAAPVEASNSHVSSSNPVSATEDFLSSALSRATGHEQKRVNVARHSRKRLGLSAKAFNVGAAMAVFILLSGFIAYQNMAYVSLRLASAKAGISGVLPGYQPSGFALSRSIASQPGQIVLSFHSNSDNRNFHITQAASEWDSQTLFDSYVAPASNTHQTISEPNGQIVYLYGDNNATWVNGGVWYRVEGKSALSSTQLLKLANSL
ncbi:MAG TPA: hypothetical protein VLF90_01565 [Patescibacteria group bacterium]|nr:hypothetical protein [Patescibacteria group bacterium]